MEKIKGSVDSIIYQNEEGYSVFKMYSIKYVKPILVTGVFSELRIGFQFEIEGEWFQHPKYGKQFKCTNWREILPVDIRGMKIYLSSGLIKGIGPYLADNIVDKFQKETFHIFETDIDKLLEVSGIGPKKMEKIKQSWKEHCAIRDIYIYLQKYGVTPNLTMKIYKRYGQDTIKKIKENPYCIARDIWGIGFKTADEIALRMGFEKKSSLRIRAGIKYALEKLAEEGHVYGYYEQTIEKTAEILDVDEEVIKQEIFGLKENKEVTLDGEKIYLPQYFFAETGVARKLYEINNSDAKDKLWEQLQEEIKKTGNQSLSVNVFQIEKKIGMEYDEVQRSAIRQAARSKIMILTGGPGTGKSTTAQGIITAYQMYGLSVVLAAPTARAAKRLSETTGLPASTVHRLLGANKKGFQKNQNNPIDGDVLVLDESSMIDLKLAYALLQAVPITMRLVIIGDTDQLPSVGAGNFLRDIIQSERFPVIRLTRIFRQAQKSKIVTNAHRIKNGYMPELHNSPESDFIFLEEETPEDTLKDIMHLVQEVIPCKYGFSPEEIQVLSPMKKGPVGIEVLNRELQKILTPNGNSLERLGQQYRKGDRVMQLRNDYDKNIFNGDIGIVQKIDVEEKSMSVLEDDHLVEYAVEELDDLSLAFSITIHKSQGSEYPVVVLPILTSHFVMLQRNLLYTALTRGKKYVFVLGQKKAIAMAVHNERVAKRNSNLCERIRALSDAA